MSQTKELDEDQLRAMLSNRTTNLLERIDRNIKIGFAVLFVFLVVFVFDDFILSPEPINFEGTEVDVPAWLVLFSSFSTALICLTFVYFAVKYYLIKRACNVACNLKETLIKVIKILQLYQRLYYAAVAVVILAITSAFVSGMFTGISILMTNNESGFDDIDRSQLFLMCLMGAAVLMLIVGSLFLFLRWGFRKLYGNYTRKLKGTLKELEEIDE